MRQVSRNPAVITAAITEHMIIGDATETVHETYGKLIEACGTLIKKEDSTTPTSIMS